MTRDEHWMMNYNELKVWVEEHHHYPARHSSDLYNWIRRNIKSRNKGLLPEWKSELLLQVENMRTHEHTGGRRKKTETL